MRLYRYLLAGCWLLALRPVLAQPVSARPEPVRNIYRHLQSAVDWQLREIRDSGWRHPLRDWTNGALYAGMMHFGVLAEQPGCLKFLCQAGASVDWTLIAAPQRYMADNYCVGQTWAQLYEIYRQPRMIRDLERLADTLLARPHLETLSWGHRNFLREWSWCDALFMGPPSLALLYQATGRKAYLDLTDRLWWRSTDFLYDSTEQLYYRDSRYFHQREPNGARVFWSRGNGWVLAGLTRVIDVLPEDYPDRARYLSLYRAMARRIASLQQPDGTWHASLLDPADFPVKETSGTGFFCYALAWGIRHGYLDAARYIPVVWKAWHALVACQHPDGRLGYVQPIGAAPDAVSSRDTEVYGVGAFLMAGSQLMLLELSGTPARILHNPGPRSQTLRRLLRHSGCSLRPPFCSLISGAVLRGADRIAPGTWLYLAADSAAGSSNPPTP